VTSAPYTDVSNFGRGIRFSVECRQRDTVNTLLLGMVSVIVDFTVKS
jgi:hypothetical protein